MNRRSLEIKIRIMLAAVLILAMIIVPGCADISGAAGNALAGSGDVQEENSEAPDGEAAQEGEGTQEGILYDSSGFLESIPEWDGQQPYCEVNYNVPDIEEIWTVTQESLDPLDSLGRCGTANSCIGLDGMPDKPRGNISEIHPTGWHSDTYDFVEGGNLYNRCHLIAHKLSGDDAVDRNLITGTSYMNRKGMLPFEDMIEEYVKSTGNHVMYRVTPCFAGEELVARGVHMQAVSVEDNGQGLSFNVFCYNVEPGIEIDYATGDNRPAGDAADADGQAGTQEQAAPETSDQTEPAGPVNTYVLNTNTRKFHYESCKSVRQMKDKNKRIVEATREEIIAQGYDPCGNCHP